MCDKLFIIGRPGGGKTTVASFIKEKLGSKIPIFHSGDYPILFEMYRKEMSDAIGGRPKYFRPAIPANPKLGFDILDPMNSPVWDIALQELEQQTQQRIRDNQTIGKNELIILEFARRDNSEALQKFSPEFLQGSQFLFVEASVYTSIRRIHKRAEENGEHFMGDDIIAGYYGIDNFPYMKGYQVLGQKVECFWNEGLSKEELHEKTNNFVESNLSPVS